MANNSVGRPPGTPKTGGRQKGTPNKATLEVMEKLEKLGCDPIIGMAHIAMGEVECPSCHGSGEAPYKFCIENGPYWAPEEEGGVMQVCKLCHGSGKEPVPTDLRGKMFAELACYVAPKRKAVEIKGDSTATTVIIRNYTGANGKIVREDGAEDD